MSWIALDLLMFASSVVLYLTVRWVSLAKVTVQFNNLAMFVVPMVMFALIGIATHASYRITVKQAVILLITGIFFAYISNVASLKSIELAPNPGYSLVISKSYVVLTTFLAIPLFGSPVTLKALAAIGLIVACSALILVQRKQGQHAKSVSWLPLALVAFVGWAFLSLSGKYLFKEGMPAITFLTYFYLIVVICIAVEMRLKKLSWKIIGEHPRSFLAIGALATSFNYFNFTAISRAPNVGYVNATNAASIGVVTIFAILLFKDEFSIRKLIGVIGVIGGLGLLFLG